MKGLRIHILLVVVVMGASFSLHGLMPRGQQAANKVLLNVWRTPRPKPTPKPIPGPKRSGRIEMPEDLYREPINTRQQSWGDWFSSFSQKKPLMQQPEYIFPEVTMDIPVATYTQRATTSPFSTQGRRSYSTNPQPKSSGSWWDNFWYGSGKTEEQEQQGQEQQQRYQEELQRYQQQKQQQYQAEKREQEEQVQKQKEQEQQRQEQARQQEQQFQEELQRYQQNRQQWYEAEKREQEEQQRGQQEKEQEQQPKQEKRAPVNEARRDEMFAFIRGELKGAEKYYIRLSGDRLRRTLNTLYEYEDVLNEEKDGHTILGEIVFAYRFHLKNDISDSKLFNRLHTIEATEVLNFFREVKKLGVTMTPNDIAEVKAIEKEYVFYLSARYKNAEELIPLRDILEMADVFSELKGDTVSFQSRIKKLYLFWELNSFIDIECLYRKGEFDGWLDEKDSPKNTKVYNEITQLLKDAILNIAGPVSDLYQNFIHRLQLLNSYTDAEVYEIRDMRNALKSELVEKKRQKQWQEWQELRSQKEGQRREQVRQQKNSDPFGWQDMLKKDQQRREEEQRRQKKEEEQRQEEQRQEEARQQEKKQQYEQYQKEQEWYQQQKQQKNKDQRYHDEQQRGQQEKERKQREKKEQEEKKRRNRPSAMSLEISKDAARIELCNLLREYGMNVLNNISDKDLKLAYLKQAREIHPDRKGDLIKSQLLNAAWTKYMDLTKELAAALLDERKKKWNTE